MEEVWLPVLQGRYLVSSLGRVKGSKRGRIIKLRFGKLRYLNFNTGVGGGKFSTQKVHKLVALAFIGPRPKGTVINHKNGIKGDNRVENLEYVTPDENAAHAGRTGLMPRGEANVNSKLTTAIVKKIRKLTVDPGVQIAKVARRLKLPYWNVWQIARYKSWRHV
jgi:hypothetical protein